MVDRAETDSIFKIQSNTSASKVSPETPRDALILHLDSAPCLTGGCEGLAEVFKNNLQLRCIHKNYDGFHPGGANLRPEMIVLRWSSTRASGRVLESLRQTWPNVGVLAVACAPAQAQPPQSLQPILDVVDDFLRCPYADDELVLRARRILKAKRASFELLSDGASGLRFGTMVGESSSFLGAVKKVPLLARAEAPVLILGETGTGKELFARALHYEGPRRNRPFIAVNCGGIPDLLFENELFGHMKGAFTNASTAQNGLITEAEGGTLFLDEVDTLSQGSQVKLLRFLQSGEYRPLGASRTIVANVRILAATNVDLKSKVESKLFRGDLYYRLDTFTLEVPALRERLGDIPMLANYFVERYAKHSAQPSVCFDDRALQKLLAYSWPGNVRELEAVVQRATVLSARPVLAPEDVDIPVTAPAYSQSGNDFRQAMALALINFEKGYITELLKEHQGNLSVIAKRSGKHRRTIQRLIRKHGLDRREFS